MSETTVTIIIAIGTIIWGVIAALVAAIWSALGTRIHALEETSKTQDNVDRSQASEIAVLRERSEAHSKTLEGSVENINRRLGNMEVKMDQMLLAKRGASSPTQPMYPGGYRGPDKDR